MSEDEETRRRRREKFLEKVNSTYLKINYYFINKDKNKANSSYVPRDESPKTQLIKTKVDRIKDENGFEIKTEVFTTVKKENHKPSCIDYNNESNNSEQRKESNTYNSTENKQNRDVRHESHSSNVESEIDYNDIYTNQKFYQNILVN